MNEVKSPKKPLIFYYAVVLLAVNLLEKKQKAGGRA